MSETIWPLAQHGLGPLSLGPSRPWPISALANGPSRSWAIGGTRPISALAHWAFAQQCPGPLVRGPAMPWPIGLWPISALAHQGLDTLGLYPPGPWRMRPFATWGCGPSHPWPTRALVRQGIDPLGLGPSGPWPMRALAHRTFVNQGFGPLALGPSSHRPVGTPGPWPVARHCPMWLLHIWALAHLAFVSQGRAAPGPWPILCPLPIKALEH